MGATHLECTASGDRFDSERLQGLSPAGKPLFARYDLPAPYKPEDRCDLWRYAAVLPVREERFRLTLGEGWTPLHDAPRLATQLGLRRVLLKDETTNPTGSFKARGLSVAISRAWELGARELAIPTAGNAGGAAAAYAAAAGLPLQVFCPTDTPAPILEEIRSLGANLELVDGLISDCGTAVRAGVEEHGWFDLSTLKEPYRVEGKKTMGYELFEQLGGRLPDAIVYPTGGGTGLVGMWKAFEEMEQLGWIGRERPRMLAVQAEGCAPMVRAWERGAEHAAPWPGARTRAVGLRVPGAVGDFLILRALRESNGGAVFVPDLAMKEGVERIGAASGVFVSLEGGATAAAVPQLLAAGLLRPDDEVALFLTGSGLNYAGVE